MIIDTSRNGNDATDHFVTALGYRVRDRRIQVYVVVEIGALDRVAAWLQEAGAAYLSTAGDIVAAKNQIFKVAVDDAVDRCRPDIL